MRVFVKMFPRMIMAADDITQKIHAILLEHLKTIGYHDI